MNLDQDVIIIGAGISGIGMAIQLVRKFGTKNFILIEKSEDVGGTWFLNSYPGCGCDVPSHFYSYSFAKNPNWSQKFSMQPEIYEYLKTVAQQYNITPHVRFRSTVEKAEWDAGNATWVVTIRDGEKSSYQQRCRFLISAVGVLSTPKNCDIAGVERFKGSLFHSATWDHSFNWKGKEVITIGNGCSATQFLPIISAGPNSVKKVTQFSRQAHWLSERPNPEYSSLFKSFMKYVPGAIYLYRLWLYYLQEKDFAGFHVKKGASLQKEWTEATTEYITKNAPERYRDALVPKTAIGCKRKVMDTHYLASLHRDNVELICDDPIKEIVEDGVVTKSGRFVRADGIVVATGFETQKILSQIEIRGENGTSVSEHWDRVSSGVAQAYHGTCITNFPNFFMLMGPNTLSGHLSVIYTTECQIGLVLRLMAPIVKPNLIGKRGDSVMVKADAEESYNTWLQAKAKQLVWATGCTSWFIDPKSGRNTIMYPDWQFMYWWNCLMVQWGDFEYKKALSSTKMQRQSHLSFWWFLVVISVLPVMSSYL